METRRTPAPRSNLPIPVIRKLLHRGARSRLARVLTKAHPVKTAQLLSALSGSEREQAFNILLEEGETSQVADVMSEMSPGDSLSLLGRLAPDRIAKYLSEMSADDATNLTSRLPEPLAAQVLTLMEAEPAADVRELLEHEERTAGRIMTRNFFVQHEEVTIAEAVAALQKRSEDYEMVFYVYVVDKHDHPVGVVSLRKLLTTHPSTQLRRIMAQDVISVSTSADQEEVARLVAEYNLLAIPVIDDEDKLVGIVTVDDVIDVLQEEAEEDLLALAGVSAEERVSTSAARSLRLRAPWLLVNLATTFLPAYVIFLFDHSIEMLPVLAALVTMPMGMGGNAATQTLTVVIRGLALNELSSVSNVALKQLLVAIGNGIINGLVAAGLAILISHRWMVGLVLGLAMVINMLVAGLAGVFIPVALRKLRVDPAVASTVFVTTFTDVGGSLSFLGLATLLLKLWA